jgi:alanyl-tRNA synthetase
MHCDRTSRVGPIRILRTKRIQDGVVRIEYSAGLAAVSGMQADKACVDQLADKMNVGREALLPAAVKLLNDVKEDRKRMEVMASKLNRIMANSLLDKASQVDGAKVVVHLAAEDEDPQALSLALISGPGVIAVIGLADKSPKVFVSRSADVKLDCRPVLKDIMKLVGGGGGGKPDFAQGGGGDPAKLPEAMAHALDIVGAAMTKK